MVSSVVPLEVLNIVGWNVNTEESELKYVTCSTKWKICLVHYVVCVILLCLCWACSCVQLHVCWSCWHVQHEDTHSVNVKNLSYFFYTFSFYYKGHWDHDSVLFYLCVVFNFWFCELSFPPLQVSSCLGPWFSRVFPHSWVLNSCFL